MFQWRTTLCCTEEAPQETAAAREVDRPASCEANWVRLLFYWPVSSSSPFIHLMEAAGLLPMAVQVSSVSFPSPTTSSRLSMIGLPGGTDPAVGQTRNDEAHTASYAYYTHAIRGKKRLMLNDITLSLSLAKGQLPVGWAPLLQPLSRKWK